MLHKLSVEVSGTDVLLVNDQGATVAVLPTYGDSETMNQQLERAYLFAGADELARSARATASCMAAQLHTPGGPRGDALDLLIAARDHLRQALKVSNSTARWCFQLAAM